MQTSCMVWRCQKYQVGKETPNVEKWDERGEFGCIMEVNLHYPETLHDYHSDYPLAPEIMNVNVDMLSDQKASL